MEVGLESWAALSAIVLGIGLYGVITRRNAILVLISAELILNAAALNFVALNRYLAPETVSGVTFAVFLVGVAAAEAAVGLAIIIRVYRVFGDIDLGTKTDLKW